jgi:ribosomal protein S27AE
MHKEIELTCPKCSSERVMAARTRYRNLIYLACGTCEHTLSDAEIVEQVKRQIVEDYR